MIIMKMRQGATTCTESQMQLRVKIVIACLQSWIPLAASVACFQMLNITSCILIVISFVFLYWFSNFMLDNCVGLCVQKFCLDLKFMRKLSHKWTAFYILLSFYLIPFCSHCWFRYTTIINITFWGSHEFNRYVGVGMSTGGSPWGWECPCLELSLELVVSQGGDRKKIKHITSKFF